MVRQGRRQCQSGFQTGDAAPDECETTNMNMISAEPQPATRTVTVDLAGRSYPIHIGPGLLDQAGRHIGPHLKNRRCTIVTDETIAGFHLSTLMENLRDDGIDCRTVILPPGEKTKSFANLESVCSQLLASGLDRSDMVVALGGGVIGDLAGFAAAVVLRGIGFVQIPTTLLAQVDSSVGGKTGINTSHGKNLVGAFHQPVLVLADTALLDTLPEREVRAGYAETVKYGLIRDEAFFDWLTDNYDAVLSGDHAARIHAVEMSCRHKADVVAADEHERGMRALLNLGHTFGHAFEAETGYSDALLHGEAVALGTAMAFRMSHRLGLCSENSVARVEQHLTKVGLPTRVANIPVDRTSADQILAHMAKDKKAMGNTLAFILVRGIGDAFVSRDVEPDFLRKFIQDELNRQ